MNPKPSPSGSSFSKSALLKIDQIIMKKFITYYPIYSEKLGFVSKYSSYVKEFTCHESCSQAMGGIKL